MAVDTNNIRKTNFEMFEETAICMQCAVWGVPFAYEKKDESFSLWLWEDCLTHSWKGLNSILNDSWGYKLSMVFSFGPTELCTVRLDQRSCVASS